MNFTDDHKEFLADMIDRSNGMLAESDLGEHIVDTRDLLDLLRDFRFIAKRILAEINKEN